MDGWIRGKPIRAEGVRDSEDEENEKGMNPARNKAFALGNGSEKEKRGEGNGRREGIDGWMDTDTRRRGGLI